MKQILFLISISILLFFTSCEKKCATSCREFFREIDTTTNLCTDPICEEYQDIWKEIFLQNNGLTEQYFNNHIKILETDISDWNSGTSFSICYNVTIDWAVVRKCDSFIIKINEKETTYPHLFLPRGVFLTKEDIIKVVEWRAFSSGVTKLTFDKILKFNSLNEAMAFLTKQSKVNTLCSSDIYINRYTGRLSLKAYAEYECESNKCIFAELDLINGEVTFRDGACRISCFH